ncbi:hypothetical protein ACOSP7_018772 [Xanthoceras sorbifolium]|uniref:Exocyst subunit Exo70 family protein n=1 Tax=Xanthoceras sorbifolium TaxID=99658 RepID=A0ABQ8I1Q6_9ROSI|nr:hypothetical protein JRO89_XS05G0129700 [Xanthoceras sorbifolium]
MEKNLAPPQDSNSFSRKDNNKAGHAGPESSQAVNVKSDSGGEAEVPSDSDMSLSQAVEEVDRLIQRLSSAKGGDHDHDHEPLPSEVPKSVDFLYNAVDSMVTKYEHKENPPRLGLNHNDDVLFFDSMNRISKLKNSFHRFPSDSVFASSLNKATIVVHRSMSFLEEEYRTILEICKRKIVLEQKTPKTPKQMASLGSDRCMLPEAECNEDDLEFPSFSAEAIATMSKISTVMIAVGYERECCLLYSALRRNAFNEELNELGFDNVSFDEVQRMQWESLELDIATWINAFKHCYVDLFSAERRLTGAVFPDHPSVSRNLYSDLAAAVIVRFLNFSDAVVMTKRSAEKLFKFLDIFETLRDLLPHIKDSNSYSSDCQEVLIDEVSQAKTRIGEAAASIFSELENSIKKDQGRTPVPSGQVHPLTRYTMNYLKYAIEYKDTLEQVFKQVQETEGYCGSTGLEPHKSNTLTTTAITGQDDGGSDKSPFSIQLMTVMDLLDANLDMKSKLYRDPALRYIFLMNNGRYILQKIKSTTEIRELMGPNWCRKRSSDLRQYHKNYQRETWSRVLQSMSPEGLMVNGKVVKPLLKERFKNFNSLFEEIHRTQSTWVVSDEQLQSELRVSISAVVIPAYRCFLGRFRQHLESGRQFEKYIKYQPEDIETFIEELFDGNPTSMQKRR